MSKSIIVVIILFFASLNSFSQLLDLNYRENIKRTILRSDSLLNGYFNLDLSVSDKLFLVNLRINNRGEIIQQLRNELLLLEVEIDELKRDLKDLDVELKYIKDEYAKMIYYAYRNKNSHDRMIFILSANSFNQSYQRLKYLQQYSNYRKKQALRISEKKQITNDKISQLKYSLNTKTQLINEFSTQATLLEEDKKFARKLQSEIGKKSYDLISEIEIETDLAHKLDTNIIIQLDTKENVTKLAIKAYTSIPKKLGRAIDPINFKNNRGLLPWPVKDGFIYNYFGVHPHPYLEGVMLNNYGIDICVGKDTEVFSVFGGIVTKVIAIPGNNFAVLVSHDNYFTVYANLETVYVKTDDIVKPRSKLGRVFTDVENNYFSKLQFQIWYKKKKTDPLKWLYKN